MKNERAIILFKIVLQFAENDQEKSERKIKEKIRRRWKKNK